MLNASSPRHSFCLTVPHYPRPPGSSAGGWFAHSFEQIYQDHRVVFLFILGGKEQSQMLSPVSQAIGIIEGRRAFWPRQLFEITLAKSRPSFRVRMKPFPQGVRG